MKRTHVALWFVAILIFVGCENSITGPSQSPNFNTRQEAGFLAKAAVYVTELDSILPSGTQYTLIADSTVWYNASGGELIASGCKTRNKYDSVYQVHLYAEMKVRFEELSSVTIENPSNLEYLNASNNWIGILSGGTVSAQAVRTDSLGSGTLTLTGVGSYDDDDEDDEN